MQNFILMDNLDKQLRKLSKIEPSRGFIEASKNRLMQQISLDQNESWFRALLGKFGIVSVPRKFMYQARKRLMYSISHAPRTAEVTLRGLALFMNYTKKVVASTLVMLIAVTATLFFVEGNAIVEASDNSYLEIMAGKILIKHPDLIVWDEINGLIEVQAGDLIKVEKDSEAILHFFDDTELRLNENSLLLISQLTVSPGFERQAIIETSLHEGEVWVQSLNVEDGYASFTMDTRDAVFTTINGTFSVATKLNTPTVAQVFDGKITLTSLVAETRQKVEDIKLTARQKATVHVGNGKPVTTIEAISEHDLLEISRRIGLLNNVNHPLPIVKVKNLL